MFDKVLDILRRVFGIIGLLLWTAVTAVATWFMWNLYVDAHEQSRFEQEGKLVQVRINDVTYEQHSWQDIFPNTVYLTFDYGLKEHKVRYKQDTTYLGAGDRVSLLYHPGLNQFRQPFVEPRLNPAHLTSRLVKWSIVDDFSYEHKVLVGLLLAASFLFFLAGGLINSIIDWPVLQIVSRFILLILLCGLGIFLVYDAVGRHRYWTQLRTNGQPDEVTVLSTDRHSLSNRSHDFKSYTYSAKVRFRKQERVIPITEDDYDTLKPNSPLSVLYDSHLDDLMSERYTLPVNVYLVPVFIWVIFVFFAWKGRGKTRRQQSPTYTT